MPQRSFQSLGNFLFHIIEGGESGAVLMAPHPQMQDRYAVYWCRAHETVRHSPKSQLGCGEIMAAVFAMEVGGTERRTPEALHAFKRANAVLACYRDMPWQHMPDGELVNAEVERMDEPELKVAPSKAMLFLPKDRKIRLSDPKIVAAVPGLFSVDTAFRKTIVAFISDIERGLEIGDPKSIILGAPSGSGKTEILNRLSGEYGEHLGIRLIVVSKLSEIGWDWDDPDTYFEKLLDERGAKVYRLLIAIDEAFKPWIRKHLKTQGMKLLDSAHAHDVRFMFMDALFTPDLRPSDHSEFMSRCVPYHLPGLTPRP